ncbi:MAG: hypothetical protein AMXMBFR4_32630 [Candidatus Hydrogenedentota bacterium]
MRGVASTIIAIVPPRRWVALTISCLAFAGITHFIANVNPSRGNDDAFISYRYSRNLVDGHGLVFNPGERVEGYSNFLYVLLIAPGFLIVEPDSIYGYALALNIGFGILAIAAFWHYCNLLLPRGALPAAAALAISPALTAWAASGMETPLVLLIQIVIWGAATRVAEGRAGRDLVALCVAIGFSVLARADGFVMPAIAIAYLIHRGKRRGAAWAGTVFVATAVGYFSWRYAYYGYPLPNTYYAKVDGPLLSRLSSAWSLMQRMFFARGLFVPIIPLALLLLGTALAYAQRWLGDPLKARHGIPSELFFSMGWLAYWFYIGGDIYLDRFLVILLPLGIVALLRIASADLPRITRRASVAAAAILLCAIVAPLAGVEYIQWHLTGSGTDGWMLIGKHLRQRHPGSVIAVDAAGKIPYYSNLRTIDIFGLNDVHIAHQPVTGAFRLGHSKTDTEYVLGREPDCIVTYISDDLKLTTLNLSAEEYRRRGYEVTHLASMWSGKIWNVARRTDEEIGSLVRQGFDCAIVAKKEAEEPAREKGIGE